MSVYSRIFLVCPNYAQTWDSPRTCEKVWTDRLTNSSTPSGQVGGCIFYRGTRGLNKHRSGEESELDCPAPAARPGPTARRRAGPTSFGRPGPTHRPMGRRAGLGQPEKFRSDKPFSTSISVHPLKSGLPHRPMGRAGPGFSDFAHGPGRAGNWMSQAQPGRAAKPMGRAVGFGISPNSERNTPLGTLWS